MPYLLPALRACYVPVTLFHFRITRSSTQICSKPRKWLVEAKPPDPFCNAVPPPPHVDCQAAPDRCPNLSNAVLSVCYDDDDDERDGNDSDGLRKLLACSVSPVTFADASWYLCHGSQSQGSPLIRLQSNDPKAFPVIALLQMLIKWHSNHH